MTAFDFRGHGRAGGRCPAVPPKSLTSTLSPLEVVDRIAPTPVPLMHGTEDHWVPVDHALHWTA